MSSTNILKSQSFSKKRCLQKRNQENLQNESIFYCYNRFHKINCKIILQQIIHLLNYSNELQLTNQDNERKKMVWCNIYVNEMDPIQLARSKKGKQCRICSMEEETSRFIYPCMCSGTAKYVHEECFKNWILLKNGIEKVYKNDIKCEVCQQKISMKVHFQEEVHGEIIQEVPRHQKACWLILIFIILLQIAGAVILGILVGFSNVGLAAAITLLGVISIVLTIYLVAKVTHSLTVETIDQWVFQNYHKEQSPEKIGSIINMPPQPVQNASPRSPRQRRKSCVPQFSGIQMIQLDQYPQDA